WRARRHIARRLADDETKLQVIEIRRHLPFDLTHCGEEIANPEYERNRHINTGSFGLLPQQSDLVCAHSARLLQGEWNLPPHECFTDPTHLGMPSHGKSEIFLLSIEELFVGFVEPAVEARRDFLAFGVFPVRDRHHL